MNINKTPDKITDKITETMNKTDKRVLELEKEIELQKKKLKEAAIESVKNIHTNITLQNWIREFPVPTATFLALGGFIAAKMFYTGDPQTHPTHQTQKPQKPHPEGPKKPAD